MASKSARSTDWRECRSASRCPPAIASPRLRSRSESRARIVSTHSPGSLQTAHSTPGRTSAPSAAQGIEWRTDLDAARAEARAEKKPLLIVVHQHGVLTGWKEAGEQIQQGCFSGSGSTNEGDFAPLRYPKRDVLKDVCSISGVAKTEVLNFQGSGEF